MAAQRLVLTQAQADDLHRRLKGYCATEAAKYYEAGGPVGVKIGDFWVTLSAMPLGDLVEIMVAAVHTDIRRMAEQVVAEVDE
ncbi:MAG: hypothetical protein IPO09_09070 [Anaeromyxobacter sp.]|nr:hypothetical protein [Anaeromyxobacter sp.]